VFDLLPLLCDYASDHFAGDAHLFDQRLVQNLDAAARDGSHRQLFVAGHAELPDQEDIQIGMQRLRDFKSDRNTAAGSAITRAPESAIAGGSRRARIRPASARSRKRGVSNMSQ